VALAVGTLGAAIGLLLMRSDDLDTFRTGTILMVAGIALLFGGVIYRMAGDDPDSRRQMRARGHDEPTPEV
jgi:hypothetical protein